MLPTKPCGVLPFIITPAGLALAGYGVKPKGVMMALKAILDSLDGLPEALSKEYAKDADGKYRLDIEGGYKTAEEVTPCSTNS